MLASSVCDKLGDLIYGEGVIFEGSGLTSSSSNMSLDFVTKDLEDSIDISGQIKDAILKSVRLGNSLLKINCDKDRNLWINALSGNRFFVDLDSRGRVVKSKSYVNIYTTGDKGNSSSDSFGLVEERYYKEVDILNPLGIVIGKENKPMVSFKIYKLAGTSTTFDPNSADTSYTYKQLPRSVQRAFREEYGTVMLNEEKILPLVDLGVYLVKHTKYLSAMPNIQFGESALAKIINYLPQYDAIDSEITLDIRVSRSKIVIPQFMGKGKDATEQKNDFLEDVMFTKVPNMSDTAQSPIFIQPNLRIDAFDKTEENICKKICNALGVSVSSLFSNISDAKGNITARQVSSENTNTTLYITNKRKLILPEINRMLKTILLFYGQMEDVKITFAEAGASDRYLNTEIIKTKKDANIISEYQAVKQSNEKWSDEQIKNEIDEIHKMPDTISNEETSNNIT